VVDSDLEKVVEGVGELLPEVSAVTVAVASPVIDSVPETKRERENVSLTVTVTDLDTEAVAEDENDAVEDSVGEAVGSKVDEDEVEKTVTDDVGVRRRVIVSESVDTEVRERESERVLVCVGMMDDVGVTVKDGVSDNVSAKVLVSVSEKVDTFVEVAELSCVTLPVAEGRLSENVTSVVLEIVDEDEKTAEMVWVGLSEIDSDSESDLDNSIVCDLLNDATDDSLNVEDFDTVEVLLCVSVKDVKVVTVDVLLSEMELVTVSDRLEVFESLGSSV
jgi:hypothetical protein